MTRRRFCLATAGLILFAALTASAQPAPSGAAPAATRQGGARAQVPQVRTVTEAQDARETRAELQQLLRRYSPALAGVFKLDPSLLGNPDYLAPYPGLAEFLSRHPEIARDPAYFFQDVELPWVEARRDPSDPRVQVAYVWRSMMEGSLIFLGFCVVVTTLVWLIKTLIDYRRWSRLSKVQAEVHNKVLDRFANNEDLLAYVQTPAGRRFLESAPIALDPAGPAVGAPLRRILFAVEAGFVIMAGGIGLQYVSRHVPAEVSPMILALGVLGLALGIGFIAAAAVSFLISRRLGLLQSAPPPPAAQV